MKYKTTDVFANSVQRSLLMENFFSSKHYKWILQLRKNLCQHRYKSFIKFAYTNISNVFLEQIPPQSIHDSLTLFVISIKAHDVYTNLINLLEYKNASYII